MSHELLALSHGSCRFLFDIEVRNSKKFPEPKLRSSAFHLGKSDRFLA